jgi:hypothetical protein
MLNAEDGFHGISATMVKLDAGTGSSWRVIFSDAEVL